MDPEEQRIADRERWEGIAGGWEAAGGLFQAGALPVSHWMVDAIAPQPAQVVLELAAGTGEVGFLAAELLRPGGTLISTDGAEAMVEGARRRAEALGVADVCEFRTMELEWIDRSAASVDAILCRFGIMLAVDPEAALREMRRVLKPGGRLALAVWDARERNPWMAVPYEEALRLRLAEPPDPAAPGPFALGAPGTLDTLLEDAGFDDVVVEPMDLVFEAPSLDAWWDAQRDMSCSLRELVRHLSPADHTRLRDAIDARWAAWVRDDGTLAMPGRALVAAAGA